MLLGMKHKRGCCLRCLLWFTGYLPVQLSGSPHDKEAAACQRNSDSLHSCVIISLAGRTGRVVITISTQHTTCSGLLLQILRCFIPTQWLLYRLTKTLTSYWKSPKCNESVVKCTLAFNKYYLTYICDLK